MSVHDGQRVELVRPGGETVLGTVRKFQTEARYDPVTGEQTEVPETRWEILTGDAHYPAIGFDPETAEFRE